MKKKSGFTIVEQAVLLVPEFDKVVHKLENQVPLRRQSKSTLDNYIQRIASVVNCQPSLARAEHVVKYPGHCTHRVAITNRHILNITDDKATFIAKDYRDGAVRKPETLYGVEFLRRFTMHILPKRFVKIRRFGIHNPTFIRNHKLQFVPGKKPASPASLKKQKTLETKLERLERLTGVNPCLCPVCKTGSMKIVRELPRIRLPGLFFYQLQL